MNTAAHTPYASTAASNVANAVALNLAQQAHLAPLDAWSAPYRSESFAEDLPLSTAPMPVKARPRWQAALLLTLPVMVALLGSIAPFVDGWV